MANKKFTSIKNDYCLTFDQDAEIEESPEDVQIQSAVFSFTPLKEIEHMPPQATIDVIGVVAEIGELGSITLKDNKGTRDKREVTIMDDGDVSIKITLWGE